MAPKPIRTRFAPSPTGDLHLGSVRTALFSWLYARSLGGSFVLRIEDTDQARSTQASVDSILEGMAWLGLDHDEGPFYQMQRMDRYQTLIDELLEKDLAYRCDCSQERLDNLREKAREAGDKPRYDGHCAERGLTSDHDSPTVIRFRNPKEGSVTFDDAVRGKITVNNAELDDLIIARSDGTPTYNFTVVVDDWDMQITHVVRGDDHINNTPRQINLFHALGATPPIFAHVPMILGKDGKRLSKRHAATNVLAYRDAGYLPEALLNGLARLGWSHGDQELFSRDELIALFSLDTINKAPAVFNEEKLDSLNQHYLQTLDPQRIAPLLADQLRALNLDPDNGTDLATLIQAQSSRCHTLKEMAEKSRYFFEDNVTFDEEAKDKHLTESIKPILKELADDFSLLSEWTAESIKAVIKTCTKKHELGFGKVAQPLRVALTGNTMSPSIDITMQLIGKERCLSRLRDATQSCQSA